MKTFTLSHFLIIATLVISIVSLIYYFVYQYNINKKLREESYNSETTQRKMPHIRTVISIAIAIIFIVEIYNINTRIERIWGKLEDVSFYTEYYLGGELSNIYASLNRLEEMNQKDELVQRVVVGFGDYHEEDHTADIIFTLIPGKFYENMQAEISFDKTNMKLKEDDDGNFSASIRMNIFEEIPNEVDYFVKYASTGEKGSIDTEFYDYISVENMWEYYLMSIIYKPECSYEYKDGVLDYSIEGWVSSCIYDSGDSFESIKLIAYVDDKIVKEIECENLNLDEIPFELKDKTNVRINNQTFRVELKAKDKFGYTFIKDVTNWEGGSEIVYAYDNWKIYDSNNKIVFDESI